MEKIKWYQLLDGLGSGSVVTETTIMRMGSKRLEYQRMALNPSKDLER